MGTDKELHRPARYFPYVALLLYFVVLSPFIGVQAVVMPFAGGLYAWVAVLPIVIVALIVVGLVGALNIWRAKRRDAAVEPKHKEYLRIAAFGFLCLVAATAIGAASGYLYANQKFNPATWQDRKSVDLSHRLTGRQRMVNDLTQHVLPGLSRDEVEELLGKPNRIFENVNGGSEIEYVLGPEMLGFDYEMLWMRFDGSGELARWDIFGR